MLADLERQRAGLIRLLRWGTVVCLFLIAAYASVAWGFNLPQFFYLAGAVIVTFAVLLVAQLWLLDLPQAVMALLFVVGIGDMTVLTVVTPELLPISCVTMMVLLVMIQSSVSPSHFRWYTGAVVIASSIFCLIAGSARLYAPLPTAATVIVNLLVTSSLLLIAGLVLWQTSTRVGALLDDLRASNGELLAARDGLEAQVAARTADLQRALAEVEERAAAQASLLTEVERRDEVIRELSVPLLPVQDDTLVLPLVGVLDADRLAAMQERTLHALEQTPIRRLIIDITGIPVVDTQVALGLIQLGQAARLLGVAVALVGISPEVAQTVVGLGLDLRSLPTFLDLHRALRVQEQRVLG